MNFFKHLHTVNHHRFIVCKICFKIGIPLRGLLHDLSKYSPTEFIPGVKYYTGVKSPTVGERKELGYSAAWLHHKGRNRHHFEYWSDVSVDRQYHPVKMPLKFAKEMFADRIAASKVYNGKNYTDSFPLDYLLKGTAEKQMHPDTYALMIELLTMLKEKGEKETFKYVRKMKSY